MNKKQMKNPKWTRDELILALDLYFRCPPGKTNKENPEILCANCHRIIHKTKPMLTVAQLKKQICTD